MNNVQKLPPGMAVASGHLFVNGMVLVILVTAFFLGHILIHPFGGLWGLLLGGPVAALWAAAMVPRWRDWVTSNALDEERTIRLARQTGLLWPREGFFLEKLTFDSPNTNPTGLRILNKVVLNVFYGLALVLIFGFLTAVSLANLPAYYWHARHGESIDVGSWRIPIPEKYTSFPGRVSFVRFSFGAPFVTKAPYGFLTINLRSGSEDQPAPPYPSIEAAVVKSSAEDGYKLQERRVIQNQTGNVYCFQFAQPNVETKVTIRCMTASGELLLSFEGSRQFSSDAYQVVAGLKRLQR